MSHFKRVSPDTINPPEAPLMVRLARLGLATIPAYFAWIGIYLVFEWMKASGAAGLSAMAAGVLFVPLGAFALFGAFWLISRIDPLREITQQHATLILVLLAVCAGWIFRDVYRLQSGEVGAARAVAYACFQTPQCLRELGRPSPEVWAHVSGLLPANVAAAAFR